MNKIFSVSEVAARGIGETRSFIRFAFQAIFFKDIFIIFADVCRDPFDAQERPGHFPRDRERAKTEGGMTRLGKRFPRLPMFLPQDLLGGQHGRDF